jgi:hypothetical protein
MLEPILFVTHVVDPRGTQVMRLPLTVEARDSSGKVVAGVTGFTLLGLMFLHIFDLPKELRGGGLGRRILQMAEEEGRWRGCIAGALQTIGFRASEFYQRHGWRVLGEFRRGRPRTSRVLLMKYLSEPPPRDPASRSSGARAGIGRHCDEDCGDGSC